MRILDLLAKLFVYGCVATVLTLCAALATLWFRGHLNTDRAVQILAILYGERMQPVASRPARGVPQRQPSFQEVLDRRALATLDADLRRGALENALLDVQNREADLSRESERIGRLRGAFERRLADLQASLQEASRQDALALLEAMSASQAKRQLLLLLEQEGAEKVVWLIGAMSSNKRRGLLAEFDPDGDADQLARILREIIDGAGQGTLIREARVSLRESDRRSTLDPPRGASP